MRWRKVPKPAGGCASRSTSSLSFMIWSRASRRVWASRSFCEVTADSERWVSASRCSRPRELAGRVGQPAPQVGDLGLEEPHLARPARRRAVGPRRSRRPDHCSSRPTSWIRPYSSHGPPCTGRGSRRVSHDLISNRDRGNRRRRQLAASGSSAVRRAGAVRRSRGRRRPGPGGASSAAAARPGAIRRAVTRNAGVADHRVARADREALDVPVAHQRLPGLRLGEAAVRAERLDEPATAGWWSRRTRRRCRPGAARRPPRRGTPTGASMSRMTRSTRLARRGQRLGEVADGEPPGRVVAAEELGRRSARATSANSSRRSYDDTRPCGPTARSSEQVSAPDPTPASTTSRAREDVGHRDDLGGVLGVDHRRAARHRDHELAEQRPEDEVLPARGRGDREPLVAADQVVVLEVAPVGEEPLARRQQKLCRRPFWSVSRTHSRPAAAPVHARPGLGRDVGRGLGRSGMPERRPGRGQRGAMRAVAASALRPHCASDARRWRGRRGRRRRWTSTPKMLPSASRRRYSAAGRALIARISVLAADADGQAQARLEGAGDRRDRHPGPAVVGHRQQGGLVDDADRHAGRGHGRRCCPPATSCARRTASASGRSPGTVRVRRARSRATQVRQPASGPGRTAAPPSRRSTGTSTITPAKTKSIDGRAGRRARLESGTGSRAPAARRRGRPRPATIVPRWGSPVTSQTSGLEHPAAVERQARAPG